MRQEAVSIETQGPGRTLSVKGSYRLALRRLRSLMGLAVMGDRGQKFLEVFGTIWHFYEVKVAKNLSR